MTTPTMTNPAAAAPATKTTTTTTKTTTTTAVPTAKVTTTTTAPVTKTTAVPTAKVTTTTTTTTVPKTTATVVTPTKTTTTVASPAPKTTATVATPATAAAPVTKPVATTAAPTTAAPAAAAPVAKPVASAAAPTTATPATKPVTTATAPVATSTITNPFQFALFQDLNKKNVGKNVMISPLSIYHIMSLTANGADRITLAEMLMALQQESKDKLNSANKDISKGISKIGSCEFANGIFTKFEPEKAFTDIAKKYEADVTLLKDVEQVNKWVSDATHEKIPTIIDTINPDDLMVLLNAVYFKGAWKKEFDPALTRKNNFMNFGKEKKECEFMNMIEKLDYVEDDDMQVVSLNYAKDNMKALIVLPKKDDINVFVEKLTKENYTKMFKELKNQKIALSLPKFEVDFQADLKANFNALGINEAFSDRADFSVMKKENDLHISQILHKTFSRVNEKGTEASAATAVTMTRSFSIDADPKPEMIVDKPFLFVIRSDKLPTDHDILFISKVESI